MTLMKDKGLLLIDPQAAFIERSDATRRLGARLCDLLDEHVFSNAIATRFRNLPGSPHQTILEWNKMTDPSECQLWTPIGERIPASNVVDKGTYTSATPEVLRDLKSGDTLFLAGLDTDCCVLTTAIDLFQRGVRPIVLADFCGSSGSEQAHDAGLACLNRLIGERNIIRDTPVPKLLKERLIQERLLEGESVSAEVRAAETVELQLDRIFQRSLAQLSIGAADRQHAFHRATLATMGLDGEPKQRTVNVRGFDPERNLLHIFTDKRSIKVTELKANPAVGLCFYDDTSRTQILLSGKAQSFMNDDDHKQTAWAKISEDEYPYYACPVAPGKELPEPHAVSSSTIVAPIGTDYLRASARENFALIEVHFNVLDWVVAQGTNCFRARFKLSDGTWHGSWVAS